MYIEDRLFSENTEEVLYSVLMDEEELDLFSEFEEYFSKKEKKNRKVRLENIDSHRGLGRAAILGGGSGLIGGYLGKRKAEELDDLGKSDSEIIRESANYAAKVGAGAGALRGIAGSYGLFRKPSALNMIGGASAGIVSGALGSYLGARKNAQTKVNKRRQLEQE